MKDKWTTTIVFLATVLVLGGLIGVALGAIMRSLASGKQAAEETKSSATIVTLVENGETETFEVYYAGDHDGDGETVEPVIIETETAAVPEEYVEPYVPETTTAYVEPETYTTTTSYYANASEWEWLVRCVSAEEGGSYLRSWYAASCILNRADYEGKTIIEVISAPGQFAVYTSGVMWEKEPTQDAINACNAVLAGDRNYEVYYFASYDAHSGYATVIDVVDGEWFYSR